jgi:outer membrane receptor protein involved in Fe transport
MFELRLDATNLTDTAAYQYLSPYTDYARAQGDPESRIEGGAQQGRNVTLTLRGSF